ncbi:MAG: divalent cation tolerance protein CutA [Bacteroidales bacterium]|nr:divalent cation tolerance protein CutA [Bacteroidales bacterium]MBN2821313.1 divalent cation tolerance protein CutA [Bacteroidales bacterium]
MILAYIISNSKEEAEKIAVDLLEKKFVYSVNIIPDVPSMKWKGDEIIKINRTIVLAKTKALLYNQIEEEVKRIQTTGTAIVFSMPVSQMSQGLFEEIQTNTLKI